MGFDLFFINDNNYNKKSVSTPSPYNFKKGSLFYNIIFILHFKLYLQIPTFRIETFEIFRLFSIICY
jgi:hypothetical protein